VTAYFDSSVITKWYLPEPDSAAALTLRARFRPPATLSHLHRVELVTAWQLKIFRREATEATVTQALADLAADVQAGVWQAPAYDLLDVYAQAEALSRRHSAKLGARTLDILHVAAALVLGEQDFVTNDDRQGDLAKACGLRLTRLRKRR
jgi:predicted nucleic acid-binding protein